MTKQQPARMGTVGETCAVCGEKLMKVRLFGKEWMECGVTVMMALDFNGRLSDGDDELAVKIHKHRTAPVECVTCGAVSDKQHPIDADHAGWLCPKCYEQEKENP